jgi:hypothetical protein
MSSIGTFFCKQTKSHNNFFLPLSETPQQTAAAAIEISHARAFCLSHWHTRSITKKAIKIRFFTFIPIKVGRKKQGWRRRCVSVKNK